VPLGHADGQRSAIRALEIIATFDGTRAAKTRSVTKEVAMSYARLASMVSLVALWAGCANPQTPTGVSLSVSEPIQASEGGCFEAPTDGPSAAHPGWAVGSQLIVKYSFERACSAAASETTCEPIAERAEPIDATIWAVKIGDSAANDLLLTAVGEGEAGVVLTGDGESFDYKLRAKAIDALEVRTMEASGTVVKPGAVVLRELTLAPGAHASSVVLPLDDHAERLCGVVPIAATGSAGVTVAANGLRTNASIDIAASDAPGPREETVTFILGSRIMKLDVHVR